MHKKELINNLKEKVEFYEYVLNNVNAAIYIFTPEGKVPWSNKGAEEISGFTAEELSKMGLVKYSSEYFHPDDKKVFEESLNHLINNDVEKYLGIYRQKNAQNEWRKLFGSVVVTKKNNNMSIKEGIGCLIDITEKFDCDNQVESILKENIMLKNQIQLNLLTKREKQVIKKIARGMSSAEIADEMQLSKNTIKTHRKNIMKKLDIHNVKDMVRFAVECGVY